jgi:protein-disulfide isomerase
VIKVKDIKTITNYGVMITPALVVDGVVKVAGKVPTMEEIREWIR